MVWFELKLLARNLANWMLTLIGITLVFVVIYPFMTDSGLLALISDKIELVPEFVIRMFGLGQLPDFTEFRPYFNLCVFYIQLKLSMICSLLGCEALICEESDGTIEFLYAQPRRRISIIAAKFISRVLMILVLNLAYGIVAVASMHLMGEDAMYLVKSLSTAVMPQICYLMLGMLISSVLPSSRTASTSSLSLFFFTYAMGIIPMLIGRWYDLEYLSPCTCVMNYDFMTIGYRPNWPRVGIMACMGIAALAGSAVIYCRKDMKLQ